MSTCTECGYNLPNHGRHCQADPNHGAMAYCPSHAPQGAPLPSDDQQLRCASCSAVGYNVKRYAA